MSLAEKKYPALSEVLPEITAPPRLDDTLNRALQAVRVHLGMDVAYISQFVGDRTFYREIDSAGQETLPKAGDSNHVDDVYCRHILEGRLPQIMCDTGEHAIAARMPVTRAVPVGSHISVPINLPDGEVYGMFCCLSFAPDNSLRERDLHVMRAFADLTAIQIGRDLEAERLLADKLARISAAIDQDEISIVYQPVYRMSDGVIAGFECLSRFSAEPRRSPDCWFAEAAEVGMGEALEIAAVRKALAALPQIPEDHYITINVSPGAILGSAFSELLSGVPHERIVLEVTEHISVADYGELLGALRSARENGLRLAVDDAGAGYASLRHILDLRPDFIKLDMSLTRNIDSDPARHALVAAMVGFAAETDSQIVAEGVESLSELRALRQLGIENAQGYLIAEPMPLEAALAASRNFVPPSLD